MFERRAQSNISNVHGPVVQRAASSLLAQASVMFTTCLRSGTSVEAFCSTLREEPIRLHDRYEAQASSLEGQDEMIVGLIGALGMLFDTQGDLAVLFDRLEKVAPEEIQPAVATVRDAFKEQVGAIQGAASDSMGSFGAALVSGLTAAGPLNASTTTRRSTATCRSCNE